MRELILIVTVVIFVAFAVTYRWKDPFRADRRRARHAKPDDKPHRNDWRRWEWPQ